MKSPIVLLALGVLASAAFAACSSSDSSSNASATDAGTDAAPKLPTATTGTVERGKYLVDNVLVCGTPGTGKSSLCEAVLALAGIAPSCEGRVEAPEPLWRFALAASRLLGDDRVFTYDVEFAARAMVVTLGLSPDGKVSHFGMAPKLPPAGG